MSLPALKPQLLPVLLIEDEPAVMAYVQAALERSGYPVVCCESGVTLSASSRTAPFWAWCPTCARPAEWTEARSMPGLPATAPIWLHESFLLPATLPTKRRLPP